jgi:hypothetical protein
LQYSFDALAQTILAFTDVLDLQRYALYVFDFAANIQWESQIRV